jgi:hypothetical protein
MAAALELWVQPAGAFDLFQLRGCLVTGNCTCCACDMADRRRIGVNCRLGVAAGGYDPCVGSYTGGK